jgi:hypothetical protein
VKQLALIAVVAAVVAASAGATTVPSIHLLGLTLTGAHFLPLKTVKVTIVSDTKKTLSTKPLKNGTFRLTLASDPLAGCGSIVKITATGPRGEAASLSVPKALCPGSSSVGVSANGTDGSTVGATG